MCYTKLANILSEGDFMIWSAVLPSFFASVVEFVEALTIVIAVGATINWKSSLWGAAGGFGVLAVIVGIFGTALVRYVDLNVLRDIVGIILVMFGMMWLKKAIMRYSGLKAVHDEEEIYKKKVAQLQAMGQSDPKAFNKYGFITSLKAVLLEGLEVAFIVITFGTVGTAIQTDSLLSAILGAACAFVLVAAVGLIVHAPLTKIPENTLKFGVGILILSFGTFWSGEGLGVEWPFSDLFILILIAIYLVLCGVVIFAIKSRRVAKGGETA